MAGPVGLFDQANFLPHGYCLSWSPELLWTMVAADAVIALSYYSIPLALLYFVFKRRNLQFHWMFVLFSVFIFACGTTHLVSILNIWKPAYWLDATLKSITAVVSMATAIFLWPLVPRASRFIDEKQRAAQELAEVNRRLSESLELLRRRSSELDRLNVMSDLLQTSRNLDDFGTTIVSAVNDLGVSPRGALYLRETGQPLMRAIASWGDAQLRDSVLPAEQCHALTGRGGERCDSEDRCALFQTLAHNHICAPLVAGGDILGILHFRAVADEQDPHVRAVIETLAERASVALANIRLRENLVARSIRDPLTGLFNRRFLDEALPLEEGRARRSGGGFGVVMFDLDRFKQLNDTCGHDAGDAALRAFAKLLQGSVRSGDIACRYGGEEFVLVLPGLSLADAVHRAERIRWALSRQLLEHCGEMLGPVTVSAGVAAYPDQGSDVATVMRAADRALYRAKENGRNRVEVAPVA